MCRDVELFDVLQQYKRTGKTGAFRRSHNRHSKMRDQLPGPGQRIFTGTDKIILQDGYRYDQVAAGSSDTTGFSFFFEYFSILFSR
jgi:hypothetical protein